MRLNLLKEKIGLKGSWKITEIDQAGNRKVVFQKDNVICVGLTETIQRLMTGNGTADDTMECKYIALGSKNQSALSSYVLLGKELYRSAMTDSLYSSNTVTLRTHLGLSAGNNASTTVDSGTSSSIFNVVDETNFNVDDYIKVSMAGGDEYTSITDITGAQITVSPALSGTPAGGETVQQLYQEAGVFGNDAASAVVDTGTLFNYATSLSYHKTSAASIDIEVIFTLN